jgi:hypothetical protein
MPEGEQVHASLHTQRGVAGQQRRRLNETVDAMPIGEADVVAEGDVVETCKEDGVGKRGKATLPHGEVSFPKDDPNGQAFGRVWGLN